MEVLDDNIGERGVKDVEYDERNGHKEHNSPFHEGVVVLYHRLYRLDCKEREVVGMGQYSYHVLEVMVVELVYLRQVEKL